MNYTDLIAHYGSHSAAAKTLGYDRQRVHAYRNGPIPLAVQVEYEVDSEGALKADVPACIRDGDYRGEKKRRLTRKLRAVG